MSMSSGPLHLLVRGVWRLCDRMKTTPARSFMSYASGCCRYAAALWGADVLYRQRCFQCSKVFQHHPTAAAKEQQRPSRKVGSTLLLALSVVKSISIQVHFTSVHLFAVTVTCQFKHKLTVPWSSDNRNSLSCCWFSSISFKVLASQLLARLEKHTVGTLLLAAS